jgi:hypothetical protein
MKKRQPGRELEEVFARRSFAFEENDSAWSAEHLGERVAKTPHFVAIRQGWKPCSQGPPRKTPTRQTDRAMLGVGAFAPLPNRIDAAQRQQSG